MYFFDPVTRSAHFRKQTPDKSATWAIPVYSNQFVNEQIRSRETSLCGLSPIRPLNQPDFARRTPEESQKTQHEVHSLCDSTNSLDS